MRRVGILSVIAVTVLFGAVFFYFFLRGNETTNETSSYRLAEVISGAMEVIVSSTGKVHPVLIVDVGSQVSGQVANVLVDYNSLVKKDEIIALIDATPFQARLEMAQADLAQAKANLAMQRASLEQLDADLTGARAAFKELARDLERQESLLKGKMVSQSIVDRAVANHDQSQARINSLLAQQKRQSAQIRTSEAQILSRAAALRERETELGNTVIRSPVEGVVINRDVDPGQTVAASLQAPVLFTIAKDLREIHLEVSVDEADIGRIREGQKARFTVDAYPDRSYTGLVIQIRKQPVEVSNIVTYIIIVSTRNEDDTLLPGMTANVEIIIGERSEAVQVPSGALRFTPRDFEATNFDRQGESGNSRRGSGQGQGSSGQGMRSMMQELNEKLDLSAEQKKSVQTVFMEMGQSIRSLQERGLESDEMAPAIEQLRRQMRVKLESIFDPIQKELYQKMTVQAAASQGVRGNVWTIGGPDGSPVAKTVMIGISDGSRTEIVSGDIKSGDLVIVSEGTTRR